MPSAPVRETAQIFIRHSRTTAREAVLADPVAKILIEIERMYGLTSGLARLDYGGRPLDAEQSLLSYGIHRGATLHLSLRARAGGCGDSKPNVEASEAKASAGLERGLPKEPNVQDIDPASSLQGALAVIRADPSKLTTQEKTKIRSACIDILAELDKQTEERMTIPGQLMATLAVSNLLEPALALRASRTAAENKLATEGPSDTVEGSTRTIPGQIMATLAMGNLLEPALTLRASRQEAEKKLAVEGPTDTIEGSTRTIPGVMMASLYADVLKDPVRVSRQKAQDAEAEEKVQSDTPTNGERRTISGQIMASLYSDALMDPVRNLRNSARISSLPSPSPLAPPSMEEPEDLADNSIKFG